MVRVRVRVRVRVKLRCVVSACREKGSIGGGEESTFT
jgi:hypothetical protein